MECPGQHRQPPKHEEPVIFGCTVPRQPLKDQGLGNDVDQHQCRDAGNPVHQRTLHSSWPIFTYSFICERASMTKRVLQNKSNQIRGPT